MVSLPTEATSEAINTSTNTILSTPKMTTIYSNNLDSHITVNTNDIKRGVEISNGKRPLRH